MADRVLIVIDMLKDFLDSWEASDRDCLTSSINQLTSWARDESIPVLWVRQEFEPDLSDAFLVMKKNNIHKTIKGTPGCQIVDDLNREPGDLEVIKKRYSAFFGTSLDETLQQLKAETVILAGINTHACVRTAAIDAYQRDYDVVIVKQSVGSYDRAHHEISLAYLGSHIASVVEQADLLQGPRQTPKTPPN